MDIEKILEDVDFSRMSKIRESLRKELTERDRELTLEELDRVVASAGQFMPETAGGTIK